MFCFRLLVFLFFFPFPALFVLQNNKKQAFNEKCDVYSFGIVLWEILTGQEPFPHHTNFSRFKRAVCYEGERPIIPQSALPSLKALIETCWQGEPDKRPSFQDIISELEKIIVDAAVSDEFGRQLWKRNFLKKEVVQWEDFAEALVEFLRVPIDTDLMDGPSSDLTMQGLKCLKAVLAEKPKNKMEAETLPVVTLEKFGKILKWLGPLKNPETTVKGHTLLDEIARVFQNSWFHGDTDTDSAQEKLSGKPGGTFLIRFSSLEGYFTVSQITSMRSIRHQRIKHQPGDAYILDGDRYPSLIDLVRERELTLSCPGSRFLHIFQDNPPSIMGYVSM